MCAIVVNVPKKNLRNIHDNHKLSQKFCIAVIFWTPKDVVNCIEEILSKSPSTPYSTCSFQLPNPPFPSVSVIIVDAMCVCVCYDPTLPSESTCNLNSFLPTPKHQCNNNDQTKTIRHFISVLLYIVILSV